VLATLIRVRSLRALVAVGAVASALLAVPAPAAAASCGDAVVADWRDNGRIDGVYAPRCYRAAVNALPEDVLVYSSAQNDITRALQARVEKSAQTQASTDLSSTSPFKLPLLIVGTLALLLLTAGFAADAVCRR
jgi:hypothetical protein